MLGLSLGIGIGATTWPSYDPDAQRLFNAYAVQPSALYKSRVDTLIKALKACGSWDLRDVMYINVLDSNQIAATSLVDAGINIKNPGVDNLTAVNAAAVSLDYRGVSGDGSTSYLIGFNPFTTGVKFTQNDASLSIFVTVPANTGPTNSSYGYYDGVKGSTLRPRNISSSSPFSSRVNSSAVVGDTSSPALGVGMFSAERTGLAAARQLYDGVQVSSGVSVSQSIPSGSFRLGRATTAGYTNARSGFLAAGGSMSDAIHLAETTAVRAFLTEMGAI